MRLQRPEPKIFWKREENGVSTLDVLSMRPYTHIIAKYAKKGYIVITFHSIPLKTSCIIKQVIPTNQTSLLTQTRNTHCNKLRNHDLLQPYDQGITSQE